MLARTPAHSPLKYADHLAGSGVALFRHVCELDLEGIVTKHQSGPYVTDRESSTWFKILNREYSQREGREELFERDRHAEPVPGLHTCDLACAEVGMMLYSVRPNYFSQRQGRSHGYRYSE